MVKAVFLNTRAGVVLLKSEGEDVVLRSERGVVVLKGEVLRWCYSLPIKWAYFSGRTYVSAD